jgi:hypothetical protein
MKKPINEIERLKLIAGLINEIDYNESVHGVKTKTSLTEAKKTAKKAPKELTIDQVNPYEFRHGLQYELGVDSDYSDESLAEAKAKVLKNLSKDANYYSTLLNQKQSHYEFKEPEVYAKGMQANADGTLKKGAGKLEKANVKDNLGKKEAGKTKPKGVKIMPDKGVTGAQKTIKEGVDDKVEDMIKSGKIKPEEVKNAAEKAMKGDSTSLVALMAGLKLAEDTVEEAKSKKINQYISVESDEDGDEYPLLNRLAISNYLKSIMDPEEVDSFMDDEEGFDESSSYFFEDEYVDVTEQEVEDWAKQEISYYLESDSDEFLNEELEEELSMAGRFKVGDVFTMRGYSSKRTIKKIEGNKIFIEDEDMPGRLFQWDADGIDAELKTGKLKLMTPVDEAKAKKYVVFDKARGEKASKAFDTKEEAEAELKKINAEDPEHGDYVIDVMEGVQPKEDKHAKIKEALKKGLKELINPKDIQAAKSTGDVVNIPAQDTAAQTAARKAQINFRTYK